MFQGRNKVATNKDVANGHQHFGNTCNTCGISMVALNPNTEVTYEGLPIVVENTIFNPHPIPGELGCCITHDVRAFPLSDPMAVPTQDDQIIKINGLLPVRIGDLLYCGAEIQEI